MSDRATMIVTLGSFASAAAAGLVLGSLFSAGPRSCEGTDFATAGGAPICSSVVAGPPPDFAREMGAANARMHKGMEEAAPSGDPDADFVRMMIPHHQGAIDMALVLLRHGRDERLKRLAQSIIVEQGQEIAYMRRLLGARAPNAPEALASSAIRNSK